ncbi:MAG: glycosyltransferase family 4 protein [Verrucomicrobia bacterium]|nr:glycosyltransferase family 4 protein [Verrucomicrobiota bacterium]
MKIAYVFREDAANPEVQSGHPASILEGLQRLGAAIEPVFPLVVKNNRASISKKIFYRLRGQYHRGDREPEFLEAAANEFDQRISGKSYDMVFSPGSEMISRLKTSRPVTFSADATFASMVDYYWDFTGLSAEYLRKGHAQEAASLAKASLAIYASEWAARSAINYYGISPEKVAVIPFGANFGKKNTLPEVERWIAQRPHDRINLIFVGKHWERKGGDLVVDTARCLRKLGHKVTLDIVGAELPARHRGLPWIVSHGLLSPKKPEEAAKLHDLYIRAHYVFVPSRAEAFGITFAEGNAFGLPAISTNTGGISGAVSNGENGYLLPLSAGAQDYADLIASSFRNSGDYQAMCRRSFATFEKRLNWNAFCKSFLDILAERNILTNAPRALTAAPLLTRA